jgi:hypothetical protein
MSNVTLLAKCKIISPDPLLIRKNQPRPPSKLSFIAILSYKFWEIPLNVNNLGRKMEKLSMD